MIYYKVKKEADQKKKDNGDIYIADELYTENEVRNQNLNWQYLNEVEVSKNKTYFCFGARFMEE